MGGGEEGGQLPLQAQASQAEEGERGDAEGGTGGRGKGRGRCAYDIKLLWVPPSPSPFPFFSSHLFLPSRGLHARRVSSARSTDCSGGKSGGSGISGGSGGGGGGGGGRGSVLLVVSGSDEESNFKAKDEDNGGKGWATDHPAGHCSKAPFCAENGFVTCQVGPFSASRNHHTATTSHITIKTYNHHDA